MSPKDWLILIGAVTMTALLGIWYTLTNVGGYLIHQFPATMLEQVGKMLTSAGNAALGAFVMVIFVAFIVVAVIVYIMGKANHTY